MKGRKAQLLAAAIVLLVVAAGLHVRVQPSGRALVWTKGTNVRVLRGRLGLAPRYTGASCLVERRGDRLALSVGGTVTGRSGEEYGLGARGTYRPPERLADGWPAGDWCTALDSRVRQHVGAWVSSRPPEEILANAREASRQAALALAAALARDGIEAADVVVDIALSEAATRTRVRPEVAAAARPAPPLLFVGLDGADWELLDRYMAAGAMPNLTRLVREGHGGVLETQHPPLSPLLWNTMLTGRSPLEHGILDFTRFNPQTGVKEPITGEERQVPAVWNMTTQAGKSVGALGFWATYPAEPVRGLVVSDRLFTFLYKEAAPPPGIVSPPRQEAWAREILRAAEESVGLEALRVYVPGLGETEYRESSENADPYSQPLSALRRILVETQVYHRLITEHWQRDKPDVALVYIQGTDSIGHVFAPYAPPRQPTIALADFERYGRVPELYFRAVDRLLGEYRDLVAASGGVLLLASDHGFRWSEGRPTELSSFAAATAAKWHRNEGMYLVWGKGIAAQPGHPGRGGIQQVCATLLALAGMPAGKSLAGPPLPGAPRAVEPAVDYSAGYTPYVSGTGSAAASPEEIAKLRALGYIGAGESLTAAPGSGKRGETRTAGWYNNEGLIHRDRKLVDEAIAAFERAIAIDPKLASALWNLSDLLFEKERNLDRSDELLVRGYAAGLPEGEKFLIGRAIGYQRAGRPERSLTLLDGAVRSRPEDAQAWIFRGRYRIESRDCAGALADFERAQQLNPQSPAAFASAGLAAICLNDRAKAATYIRRALELDPRQTQLRKYLAELEQ